MTPHSRFNRVPGFVVFCILALPFIMSGSPPRYYSVQERVEQFGPGVKNRMTPFFDAAQIPYPPSQMAILAFKDTGRVEVYAKKKGAAWGFIRSYPILAASGTLGPKLKEGDRQVPEGVYKMASLNPNSRFHLSIRVNYPNAVDRKMAAAEGRTNLGGDIMIHGNRVSVGCLAMGDPAAEDLFIMAAHASKNPLPILISPTDFRLHAKDPVDTPAWIKTVYTDLRKELANFPDARKK